MAERLLRRLAPGREGDIIAGDLREEFAARGGGRIWYWGEVLSCLAVRLSPHRLTAPDLRQDLHYAVRVLRRNPGYALIFGPSRPPGSSRRAGGYSPVFRLGSLTRLPGREPCPKKQILLDMGTSKPALAT
jgi:hypothetical protein